MRLIVSGICFILLISSFTSFSAAENEQLTGDIRYISDFLVINIKDRLERPFSVVGIVKSGDPVKVLEETETYFRVETSDGKEGWISKQYVTSDTPKPIIIKQLERETESLKAQIASHEHDRSPEITANNSECVSTLNDLEQKLRDAETTIEQMQVERDRFRKNSETEDVPEAEWLKLQNDNLALNEDLAKTRQEYGQLVAEFDKRGKTIAELHNTLAKQENKTKFLWFGAGALVFLLGLVSGKAASKKKSKFTY